jgi:tRNA A37 threonylcarbamoyladenosine modification protein TsaB
VSVLPAGKGEMFVQARSSGSLVLPPVHIRIDEVAARVAELVDPAQSVTVVGEAAMALDWTQLGRSPELRVEPPHDLPRAVSVGQLALARMPVDADALEPVYVRAPEITMPKSGARP